MAGMTGVTPVNKNNKKTTLNGKPIHPALHIEPGFSSVGVIINGTYWIATSQGNHRAENVELAVPYIIHPEIADRFQLRPPLEPFQPRAGRLILPCWGCSWEQPASLEPSQEPLLRF